MRDGSAVPYAPARRGAHVSGGFSLFRGLLGLVLGLAATVVLFDTSWWIVTLAGLLSAVLFGRFPRTTLLLLVLGGGYWFFFR